ncbi:hypothetical protein [Frigidibacter oleivorans]|uniref:hypothetical protein n=1 Tax=Frigidibacter oleivorans TaxID=2487129 RepID=UPI000F8CEB2F|nr:hypothetical protein [Frigidibacter oleivorans]
MLTETVSPLVSLSERANSPAEAKGPQGLSIGRNADAFARMNRARLAARWRALAIVWAGGAAICLTVAINVAARVF